MKRTIVFYLGASLLLAGSAFATSLTTSASSSGPIAMVNLSSNPPGTIVSAVSFPSPPYPLLGTNSDLNGPPSAVAIASDGGGESYSDSSVNIDAVMSDGAASWNFEAFANTSFTTTNLGSTPATAWVSYGIDPFTLLIFDGDTNINNIQVGFEFELLVNGSTASSGWATLNGDSLAPVLSFSGPWGTTMPPPSIVLPNPSFPASGFAFAGLGNTINLGTLAPGQSVSVETHVRAFLSTPGFQTGGNFDGGDLTVLTQLNPEPSVPGPQNPPVPEPASAALLAFGGLAIALRRRSQI